MTHRRQPRGKSCSRRDGEFARLTSRRDAPVVLLATSQFMRDLSTISELRDSLERHLKHDTLSADVILQELSSLELRRRWALSVILDLQQALLSQGHKHDRILATAYLTLGAVEAKQTWALLDTQWRCLVSGQTACRPNDHLRQNGPILHLHRFSSAEFKLQRMIRRSLIATS